MVWVGCKDVVVLILPVNGFVVCHFMALLFVIFCHCRVQYHMENFVVFISSILLLVNSCCSFDCCSLLNCLPLTLRQFHIQVKEFVCKPYFSFSLNLMKWVSCSISLIVIHDFLENSSVPKWCSASIRVFENYEHSSDAGCTQSKFLNIKEDDNFETRFLN